MRILVPLNNKDCVTQFSDAGADEFYMGFYDLNWIHRFGEYVDINRMSGFGLAANRYEFNEISDIANTVKKLGKKLFITLNANVYSQDSLRYIQTYYFPALKEIQIDGLIVSDITSASLAKKFGIPVSVSTIGGVYNHDIAKEYASLGVQRIILPRDLSLDEIKSIIEAFPEVEYEVFHMRNGCIFSDSYCLGMHRPECGSTCGYIRFKDERILSDLNSFQEDYDIMLNDNLYNHFFHAEACGMCAIYRFMNMGVSSLKIVGRADDTDGILSDIRLTAENIRIASECRSEEEYLEKMHFHDNAPRKCMFGYSCYYPEVRFGKDQY